MVPQLWFVIALSWASGATLLLIYTLMQAGAGSTHQLESLPDVKPATNPEGVIQPKLVPANASMPRSHTLKLGESARFGDVVVTVVRVTRAPLTLVNFSDATKTKPLPAPALNLWLRFENVSQKTPVVPLGRELVFARHQSKVEGREAANTFVCRAADKATGNVVLVYNHIVTDVWDLRDQQVDRELQPGESFETYIPCDPEGVANLSGDLLWRVHFRKGHNADTKRGVTTLIEVSFSSDQITAGNG